MINRMRSIHVIFLVVLIALTSGCGAGRDDLDTYIKKIKSRTSTDIEPIPEFEPLPKYEYPEHQVRRSPFKPTELAKEKDIVAPDKKRIKQALESYPLDALKFVGTFKSGSTLWALIKQPNQIITRVKAGDYMGQDYGRVLRVRRNKIKLEETISVSGKWVKKITKIPLNTEKNRE